MAQQVCNSDFDLLALSSKRKILGDIISKKCLLQYTVCDIYTSVLLKTFQIFRCISPETDHCSGTKSLGEVTGGKENVIG